MGKTIYRLDLTKEELDSIKDKLDENLIKKIKEIEITDKKLSSISKALSLKVEIAKAKFMEAMADLNDREIEPTQYNLRKYKKIPYQTSKKYLDMLALAQEDTEIGFGYEPDENIITRTIEDVELEIEYNRYLIEKYSKKEK